MANRYPATLAGVLILSAYLLPGATDVTDANAATPTLFGHGRYDDVVPFIAGQRAHAATQSPKRAVGWRDYPCGHEVAQEEIRDVARFLHERLPRS